LWSGPLRFREHRPSPKPDRAVRSRRSNARTSGTTGRLPRSGSHGRRPGALGYPAPPVARDLRPVTKVQRHCRRRLYRRLRRTWAKGRSAP
jgi:hypothetical protein